MASNTPTLLNRIKIRGIWRQFYQFEFLFDPFFLKVSRSSSKRSLSFEGKVWGRISDSPRLWNIRWHCLTHRSTPYSLFMYADKEGPFQTLYPYFLGLSSSRTAFMEEISSAESFIGRPGCFFVRNASNPSDFANLAYPLFLAGEIEESKNKYLNPWN